MIKLAFVFRAAPYGTSQAREGLDALLAASAFCEPEQIAVFFVDDGVLNLLAKQQAQLLLQRDLVHSLKLLDLYEIEQRYVCRQSIEQLGLTPQDFIIQAEPLPRPLLLEQLRRAEKILTF